MFLSTLIRVGVMNLVLSSDNALMIAVVSSNAASKHRFRALTWSYVLSAGLQLVLLSLIAFLFRFTFLQGLFGIFICFMAYQLLHKDRGPEETVERQRLLPLVGKITLGNLMMSFENAAALIGIASGKVWIAWLGVVITSSLVFFGSHMLSAFLNKYDFIIYIGAVLLFWIGAKLVFTEPFIARYEVWGPIAASAVYFIYVAYTYFQSRSKSTPA